MAKKKIIDTSKNVADIISSDTSTVKTIESVTSVVNETDPQKEVTLVPKDEALGMPTTDISALHAQEVEYLKRHSEVDVIYIDKFGGMFPKDTPKVFVKDAILYQNPYFKH